MSLENINDINTLWAAFLKGDDKAFSGIYTTYSNSLISYGKKMTRDHEILQDSIQEVFLDLFQKRGKIHKAIHNPKAYLFIAVKNCILKKLVHQRRFDDREVDDAAMGEFNIEYSFQDSQISFEISHEKQIRLQKAILTLSPRQKEIIYLKFEEGLDYKAIAELMGITIDSARKQIYRALLSLREIIDNETFFTFFNILFKNG